MARNLYYLYTGLLRTQNKLCIDLGSALKRAIHVTFYYCTTSNATNDFSLNSTWVVGKMSKVSNDI